MSLKLVQKSLQLVTNGLRDEKIIKKEKKSKPVFKKKAKVIAKKGSEHNKELLKKNIEHFLQPEKTVVEDVDTEKILQYLSKNQKSYKQQYKAMNKKNKHLQSEFDDADFDFGSSLFDDDNDGGDDGNDGGYNSDNEKKKKRLRAPIHVRKR